MCVEESLIEGGELLLFQTHRLTEGGTNRVRRLNRGNKELYCVLTIF